MNTKHCPNCNTVMVKTALSDATIWWKCPDCGAIVSLRKTPPKKPNTSLRLTEAQREWLKATFGGIQPGIKALIDQAMKE